MTFYSRFVSKPYSVVVRRVQTGVFVGATVQVKIDFACDMLEHNGMVIPSEATVALEGMIEDLFEDKFLVDNQDPYADDIMKMQRIRAARVLLFDHGTSGPQLAYHVRNLVEDYLAKARWQKQDPSDPAHVQIAQVDLEIDGISHTTI